MPTTETDLRAAFAALALDDGAEPDVTALRARLATLTVDDHDDAARTGATDDVVDITSAPSASRPDRRHRSRLLLLTAAAVLAALVGLVIMVLPHSATPVDPAAELREIGGVQYPGTVALAYVEGTGPRTLPVPDRALPDGFVRRVAFTCDGPGRFLIDGAGLTECSGSTSVSVDLRADQLQIALDTPPSTTWRLVFTHGPQTRTNGSTSSPVDEDLAAATPGRNVTAGRGTGTVVVPAAPSKGQKYQVKLTCSGSGVRVPAAVSTDALNSTGKDGISTRSCFAGFQYNWQNVTLRPGERLTVDASPGTTWRILVAPS